MKTYANYQKLILLIFLSSTLALISCKKEEIEPENTALEFDGLNGILCFGNATNLNPTEAITISMWLKIAKILDCNEENNWRVLIYDNLAWLANSGYDVIIEEDLGISWDIATVGGSIRYSSEESKLPIGKWVFLTFVYDATSSAANIYMDGNKVAGNNGANGYGKMIPASYGPSINFPTVSPCTSYQGNFPGSIDDLSFWNIALSVQQIRDIKNKGIKGNETGLISYWPFNKADTTITTDISGNNIGYLEGGVSLIKRVN